MGVLLAPGRGQVDLEETDGLGADVAEEEVAVMVHRAAGDVLRRLGGVAQHRHFLPVQQPGGQGPCVLCGKPATANALFARAY